MLAIKLSEALSRVVRPKSERKDLDPFEQVSEVLDNTSYLPSGIEVPDLLTEDIEQKVAEDGKKTWFSDGWQDRYKEEIKKLSFEFKIDTDKYEIWVGHHSWIQEIWAVPVELRIIKTGEPIQASSSRFCYSLREAVKHLCKQPHDKSPEKEGKEDRKVMLLLNIYCNTDATVHYKRAHLMALYSKADERFAKLCTILLIWKKARFNKVDTERVFPFHAFELMLINFLQIGCQPPVLPCLHEMGIKLKTATFSDIKYKSKNNKSLGNLLFNFFNYYEMKQNGGFDFRYWMISVKRGDPILLFNESKGFWVEDPVRKGPNNIVDESKCPGMSHILTYMFSQIREGLMKERRLNQLDDSLAA